MIFTLEIPHQGKPGCWFAFNEDDFIRKVLSAGRIADAVIFSANTAREMLAARGWVPNSPIPAARHENFLELATLHGLDAPLYRADYLLAPGHYQVEPVSKFVAYVAAAARDLKACRVYYDEERAMDALYNDPLLSGEQGFYAHMALRAQLTALEVLSDDL